MRLVQAHTVETLRGIVDQDTAGKALLLAKGAQRHLDGMSQDRRKKEVALLSFQVAGTLLDLRQHH